MKGGREPKPVSPLPHFPLCAKVLIIGKASCAKVQAVLKNTSRLACTGVGAVAAVGAGVLGAAGVEAAGGLGLEVATGCVEEGGFTVLGVGVVRGVTFGAGASGRSNLFS